MPDHGPDPSRDVGQRARPDADGETVPDEPDRVGAHPLDVHLRARHAWRASRLGRALGAEDDLPLDPDLEDRTGRASRPSSRAAPSMVAAVFAGGFVGSLARDAVERAWPTPPGHFPTATFVINTSGAFLLGLLLTILIERVPYRSRWLGPRPVLAAHLRVLVGAGLLGGWTTYSTMVVDAAGLVRAAQLPLAAGYLALSLVCGLTGTVLGIALGRSRALDAIGRPSEASARAAGHGTSGREGDG